MIHEEEEDYDFFLDSISDEFLGTLGRQDLKIISHDSTNHQNVTKIELFDQVSAYLSRDSSTICRNGIEEDYRSKTVWNGIGIDQDYDIAVLLQSQDEVLVPIGFIVVELGECKRYPKVWTVNLICSSVGGGGQILLGLYLFTIFKNDFILVENKFGLLELANAYLNVAGLASYTKLGFKISHEYYTSYTTVKKRNKRITTPNYCFGDIRNLPLATTEINEEFKNEVIAILSGGGSGVFKKPAICNIGDPNLQLYLGLCKNLFIFLTKNPKKIDIYILADKRKVDYVAFSKFCMSLDTTMVFPNPTDIVKNIISTIEERYNQGDFNADVEVPGFVEFKQRQSGRNKFITFPKRSTEQSTEQLKKRRRTGGKSRRKIRSKRRTMKK